MRCPKHDLDLETVEALQVHILEHLIALEAIVMTQFANQQDQLNAATAAMTNAANAIANFGTELEALKSQDGAGQLDFTGLDSAAAALNAAVTAASVSAPVVSTSALQVDGNHVPTTPAPVDSAPTNTAPASTNDPATGSTDSGSHSAPDKPLYEHTGTEPIDATVWPTADVTAEDGTPLYQFANDTASGEPTGAGTDWAVYTGPTKPAEPSPAS